MNLVVNTTNYLKGELRPPASKSYSIRHIFLATLSGGESSINNVLDSTDTADAIRVCQVLGAKVTKSESNLYLKSNGPPFRIYEDKIDSGNSGITTNFIMPLIGLRDNPEMPIILDCGDQMRERPINGLIKVLSQLGLKIEYLKRDDVLPVRITGALRGARVVIDGSTSQPLSALLMALPCVQDDSEIIVHDLFERPYVDMTLECLKGYGIQFSHQSSGRTDIYKIKGGQRYQAKVTHTHGDFSSASYMIAAAALIPGEVTLHGLCHTDSQGDKQLIAILEEMGADIIVMSNSIRIRGGNQLKGIKIDAHDIPDLLPTIAVIATRASGQTEVYNVANARIKETDRICSMANGLARMGARIKETTDSLIISQGQLQGSYVKGYNDHRTVMALAIAGLLANGTTVIDDALAINKTFPRFVELMQSIGADMELKNASNQ